jgi:hypothetical protein
VSGGDLVGTRPKLHRNYTESIPKVSARQMRTEWTLLRKREEIKKQNCLQTPAQLNSVGISGGQHIAWSRELLHR